MHASVAAGTSMLIEDVACPVSKLADMTVDLVEMFQKYGYKDASCFGHALEGNLHLVFSQVSVLMALTMDQRCQVTAKTQEPSAEALSIALHLTCAALANDRGQALNVLRGSLSTKCTSQDVAAHIHHSLACKALWLLQGFRSAEEVQRFSDMMDEMCYIVATKHSGSLKVQRSPMLGSHMAHASLRKGALSAHACSNPLVSCSLGTAWQAGCVGVHKGAPGHVVHVEESCSDL